MKKSFLDVYEKIILEMNEADDAENLANECYKELNDSSIDESMFVQIFSDEIKPAIKDDPTKISNYANKIVESMKKFITTDDAVLNNAKKIFISKLTEFFKK